MHKRQRTSGSSGQAFEVYRSAKLLPVIYVDDSHFSVLQFFTYTSFASRNTVE